MLYKENVDRQDGDYSSMCVATLDDLKAALVEHGFVAVPLEPTGLRIASIGMTIQGTMDRMELTYDDISEAVYRVAIEPEGLFTAVNEAKSDDQ
jgi:hypothetical protein